MTEMGTQEQPRAEQEQFVLPIGRPPRAHTGMWVTAVIVAAAAAFAGGFFVGRVDRVPRSELDAARADAAEQQKLATGLRSEVTRVRGALEDEQGKLTEAQTKIAGLTERGTVPSFNGDKVADAKRNAVFLTYGWKSKVEKRTSTEKAGTVIDQEPKEGSKLERSRTITLVVAQAAPKEWKTIATFDAKTAEQTDEFTIPDGARARIVWKFDGKVPAVVELKRPESSDQVVRKLVDADGPASGTTRVYDDGKFFLDVQGRRWSIQVQLFQ
jgi:hypothetical protein